MIWVNLTLSKHHRKGNCHKTKKMEHDVGLQRVHKLKKQRTINKLALATRTVLHFIKT